MGGSCLKNPKLPENFQQNPFIKKVTEGHGELLQTSWCQILYSWGQVMVRSPSSCKSLSDECYSLSWEERARSQSTTNTLWGPCPGWEEADLSWWCSQGQDPRSCAGVITEGARYPTQLALRLLRPPIWKRAVPADCDPGRLPLLLGCRDWDGERFTPASRPEPSQWWPWWGLWSPAGRCTQPVT